MTPERPQVAPLYYAALQGFSQIVEYLLTKHPEDVNARGGRWATPLHAALRKNHDEVAGILIPHADLSAKDDYKYSLLHLSVVYGRLELARMLLEHNADVNPEPITIELHCTRR